MPLRRAAVRARGNPNPNPNPPNPNPHPPNPTPKPNLNPSPNPSPSPSPTEVEEAHKQHLAKSGNAAELVHGGDVHAGIETYAQRNEWDAALQLASQQGPHILVKYATLHGAYLLQHDQYVHAAAVFARHGTSTQPPNLQVRLALT